MNFEAPRYAIFFILLFISPRSKHSPQHLVLNLLNLNYSYRQKRVLRPCQTGNMTRFCVLIF